MGLTVKEPEGGQTFEPTPEGLHEAICYGVFDLGTHMKERWEKEIREVLIMWELPQERIAIDGDDKPRAISKRYTLSLHEKSNLRRDLESWRGKRFTEKEKQGFDLIKLLGIPCQLQVIHNRTDERIYANVSTVIPAPKGTNKHEPENEPVYFSFEEEDMPIPAQTPDWIANIIQSSKEWGSHRDNPARVEPPPPDIDPNDEIPF